MASSQPNPFLDKAAQVVEVKTRPRPKKKPYKRKKATNNISPEGRQKLRDLANQRVADGKMGGSKFGKMGGRGNTREKRLAMQTVAEAAQDYRDEIIAVFTDSIEEDRSIGTRLRGAELWMKVEEAAEKITMARDKADNEQLSRGELIKLLAEKLSSGPTSGLIAQQLEAEIIPDVEVVEEASAYAQES